MNCNEAAEFVSALCDGESVSPTAAAHIGVCPICHAQLQEYLAMGAEMRRVASLEPVTEVGNCSWSKGQRPTPSWWTKGWESMRIPRFAFAVLVITVVALGSSLVVVRARAHTEGSVLMLTAEGSHGPALRCALSLVDKKWGVCAWLSPPRYLLGIEVLSHTEDQVELGIREQYNPAPVGAGSHTEGIEDLRKIPQKSYWFRPGEKLELDVSGTGPLVITGELMDHIPPFAGYPDDIQMDPKADELRVTSPLLCVVRRSCLISREQAPFKRIVAWFRCIGRDKACGSFHCTRWKEQLRAKCI